MKSRIAEPGEEAEAAAEEEEGGAEDDDDVADTGVFAELFSGVVDG